MAERIFKTAGGTELQFVVISGQKYEDYQGEIVKNTFPSTLRKAHEDGQKIALWHAKLALHAAKNPQKP